MASSSSDDRSAKPLSRGARGFAISVAVIGGAVLAFSTWRIGSGAVPPQWIVFGLLTLASGAFTVKIPGITSRLSVSEIFAFTCALLFGPATSAVTLALDGLLVSLRWKMSPLQTVFNIGNIALSMWLAAQAFFILGRVEPLFVHTAPYARLIVPLFVMTVAYFVTNSGLTAAAVASESGKSVSGVWREHFMPLAPSYFAGASVALLLVVAFQQVRFSAIALILPVLFISYLTQRSTLGRLEDSQAHVADLNRLLLSTVETLATAIDAKDEVTHDHVRRVQRGALALAREMGVRDELTIKALEAAALLHDTGKIAVPEHILNKPGKLTDAEFEKMKRHAPIGAEILSSVEFPYPVVPIVRHHHENWDGTGYPDKLKGADIPLGARILSVVDCYDALTSDRPYRQAMTDEAALAILRQRRGTMYDPVVVDTFIAARARIMPVEEAAPHPAARAIGDARAKDREEDRQAAAPAEADVPAALGDGVLAVTSLTRALSGQAQIGDVGALVWMILRQTLPCDAMSIALVDERTDSVAVRFAAGMHAAFLRTLARPTGAGIAGWVAVNLRAAVNADPALEFGPKGFGLTPALQSCLSLPLVESEALVAVLSVYAERPRAYSDDHVRLLELVAPRLASALIESAIDEIDLAGPALAPRQLHLVKRTS